MTSSGRGTQDHLGGRLALLAPAELSDAQRELYAQIRGSRAAAADRAGYTAVLADGRLIGPFNPLLHVPALGMGLLTWSGAIGEALERSGISPATREIAILAVTARRRSAYACYAHSRAARHAGVTSQAIDAMLDSREPDLLQPDQAAAYRLATTLAAGSPVDDVTYTAAMDAFGVTGVAALVGLVGQYLTTCAVLSCFAVPAPGTP